MTKTKPWTIGKLLLWTADYLKRCGDDSPRLDAEVLLAAARGCSRIDLYTTFDETASDTTRSIFRELVRRRAAGVPVAYLVGRKEFYSLSFRVTPDVLVPRPETELLVVALLDYLKTWSVEPIAEIVDVGTGSGVIAISVAKHDSNCHLTAVDISSSALEVARENAQDHGVEDRVTFVKSDLFDQLPPGQRFHAIASNPPYVSQSGMETLAVEQKQYEPRVALVAGKCGTEVIDRLIAVAPERLHPDGWLLIEVGAAQATLVEKRIEESGWFQIDTTRKDLAGIARIIQARKVANF